MNVENPIAKTVKRRKVNPAKSRKVRKMNYRDILRGAFHYHYDNIETYDNEIYNGYGSEGDFRESDG